MKIAIVDDNPTNVLLQGNRIKINFPRSVGRLDNHCPILL